ncbi:MAG: hypothetical protein AAF992_12110 [Bacteroidota bacterium]
MKLIVQFKKIMAALPALVLFLLASAVILEVACVYGLFRSAMAGQTGDVSIYLLIILVLGVMITVGLVAGKYMAKP